MPTASKVDDVDSPARSNAHLTNLSCPHLTCSLLQGITVFKCMIRPHGCCHIRNDVYFLCRHPLSRQSLLHLLWKGRALAACEQTGELVLYSKYSIVMRPNKGSAATTMEIALSFSKPHTQPMLRLDAAVGPLAAALAAIALATDRCNCPGLWRGCSLRTAPDLRGARVLTGTNTALMPFGSATTNLTVCGTSTSEA